MTEQKITWQMISRALGALIVLALLVEHLAGLHRDEAVTLAFLGIATTLLGAPAGWALIKRNGNGHSRPPNGGH